MRTSIIKLHLLPALGLALAACSAPAPDYFEATIPELHDQMARGELTSERLVGWYLDRIEAIDRNGPSLDSVIELNPDALQAARALDTEWRDTGPRGPLHGIPVLLKANIDTADGMHTTAGSLALADHIAPRDAFLVGRLREAGAVILGKTNLSEWANFRSTRSTSGWSSIGGQTKNPYDTARNPCGSSSGSAVAVAANLTAVAVGTETDGSIICPSGINGIVGIKPTLGLVSRIGIIPIAHSQDTAGPMARSVRDAAILLGAMSGADPDDPATDGAGAGVDYTANLAADALAGRRIGVVRSYYGAGSNPDVEAILTSSIEALERGGAEIVDPINLDTKGMGAAEDVVLLYEFKADLDRYLEQSEAPIRTLDGIIAFNESHTESVMPYFGQEYMLSARDKGPLTDPAYLDALDTSRSIARKAVDEALAENRLDALIVVSNGPAWMTDHVNGDSFSIGSSSYAAVSGYPSITVPAGFVSGLPIGLSFVGAARSDKQLIEFAYAFEQATRARRAPEF